MKKSAIYKFAQLAVLDYDDFTPIERLAVLKELMDRESLELFSEEQKAKEGEA